MNPYDALANAIVIQAAEDTRLLAAGMWPDFCKPTKGGACSVTLPSLKSFFCSDHFIELAGSNVDGESLFNELIREHLHFDFETGKIYKEEPDKNERAYRMRFKIIWDGEAIVDEVLHGKTEKSIRINAENRIRRFVKAPYIEKEEQNESYENGGNE